MPAQKLTREQLDARTLSILERSYTETFGSDEHDQFVQLAHEYWHRLIAQARRALELEPSGAPTEIEHLIERSSLGTSVARTVRRQTPRELVSRTLERSDALEQPSPSDEELRKIAEGPATALSNLTGLPIIPALHGEEVMRQLGADINRALYESGREAGRAELNEAVGCAVGAVSSEVAQLDAKLDRVAELLTGFEEQIAGRRAELERRGGRHVPHHGDFCSCPPSALNRLEWWVRAFREVLK